MDQPIRVLVVDDEEPHAQAVAESLERLGYQCTVASSGREGVRLIEEEEFDIVLTDLLMSDIDGMGVLAKAKKDLPNAEVVILTGRNETQDAVAAIQAGAAEYLIKPLDIGKLRAVVEHRSQAQRLARKNLELKRQLDEKFGFEGVIGNSPAMHVVLDRMKQIAPTSATVLITGESGTGKELVAKALHVNSSRRNKPYVALNCAELSENVLESELFGHVKGAFTGADRDRVGRVQYANGGTLFLDEIGDIPMTIQVKLLRVLETGDVIRVGTNEPVKVNVRLVSATNRDLAEVIAAGKFRQDLFHRLKVVSLRLPPLRSRKEDIPLLIDFFLKDFTAAHDKTISAITPAVRRVLAAYSWPGNVRELRNVIESMIVVDSDGVLDVEDLTEDLQAISPQSFDTGSGLAGLIGRPLDEVEKYYIAECLKMTGGNREEAARMLGIGERTLYRKIKEYGIG